MEMTYAVKACGEKTDPTGVDSEPITWDGPEVDVSQK